MYNRLTFFLTALALTVATTVATTASAQTVVDVSGRVVRVDPGAQVVVLDNNQAFRVTSNTILMVDNRPVPIATLQPGQAVFIRSGEAVAVMQAPATAPAPVTSANPSNVVVVAPGAPAPAQQTLYGRVTDVDSSEIKIRTDSDKFEVKVPREVAARVRKGDNVRVDLTFQPSR